MRRKPAKNKIERSDEVVLTDLFMAFGGVAVVLMMAALAAMGVPEIKASDFEKLQDQAAQDRADADASNGRAEHAEGQLKPRPLDVVIVLDGSNSMTPWMTKVRTSIEVMAEVCARVAPRFRLGLVIYRQDTTVFDLQVIGATDNGHRSEGMDNLLSFANDKTESRTIMSTAVGEVGSAPTGEIKLEPKLSGYLTTVNPYVGIQKGISMFGDANARKVLVIIGDVGPWELDDPTKISAGERATAKLIHEMARDFSGLDTRVLALFTGADAPTLPHKQETEAFFRRLAVASSGAYADDPNQLAAIVLAECLRQGGPSR